MSEPWPLEPTPTPPVGDSAEDAPPASARRVFGLFALGAASGLIAVGATSGT